jgi:hypothetical protein
MDGDRGAVVPHYVSDAGSRRTVLAAVLGGVVGLIGQHKDNPTRFVHQHKDNPTLEGRVSPERPIDRLRD